MSFGLGLQLVGDAPAGREAGKQIPWPCFSTVKSSPAWISHWQKPSRSQRARDPTDVVHIDQPPRQKLE